MKFLDNLSMAKKMVIFTVIAVAGLCIVGFIGLSSLMQTTDTLDDMYEYNLQNIIPCKTALGQNPGSAAYVF